MLTTAELWKRHPVGEGETLTCRLGPLTVWVYRGRKDWYVAHANGSGDVDACSLQVSSGAKDPGLEWKRWILDEKAGGIRLHPVMPDRPIIVRPEMPMSLMPKQSVEFLIELPVWLALTFDRMDRAAVELPTVTLSNSWFGPLTHGELCYALKTTAKMYVEELSAGVHRAVFPLNLRNLSADPLDFQRLCIRPQHLNLFQGRTRLWTARGRISYRGSENWSRMVYAAGAPPMDEAVKKVGSARETVRRGAIMLTFDNLKHKMELP